MLKISCNLYLDSIVSIDSYVSLKYAVISGVHDFASLEPVLNVEFFSALICQTIYSKI